MTVYRHRGTWMWDFWKHKVRHREGGYKTRKAAEQAEKRAKRNLKAMNLGFIQWCESRLKDLEARRTKRYFDENKKLIERLLPLWVDKKEITRADVEDYLFPVAERAPSQANKELKMIKRLFNHAIERDWYDENPAAKIPRFPTNKKPKYIPPFEDLIAFLLTAIPLDRFYFLVIINTMGRMREVNRLEWKHIKEDYLTLWTRKSRYSDWVPRDIPLNDTLLYCFSQIPKVGEYVFTNPKTGTKYDYRKKLLKGLCKRAGIKYFTFHALRHFGASKLALEGEALTDIQKLLGHGKASTTSIYLQSLRIKLDGSTKKLQF